MKYEYKIITLYWNADHSVIEKALNDYGAEGWNAVDFRWHSGSHDYLTITLERAAQ